MKRCKDCPPDKNRPAPHPGPRCATHWRAEKKRRKARAHARHIQKKYGITAEDYQRLHEHQEGVCALCKRATGKSKKLAVDHDHETKKLRGLLCSLCNRYVVGKAARDDPEYFDRGAEYLRNPPASRLGLDRPVPSQA